MCEVCINHENVLNVRVQSYTELRLLLFYTCKSNVKIVVQELFSVRGKIFVPC